jgi:hypothetical protein
MARTVNRVACRRQVADFLHLYRQECNARSFARGVGASLDELEAFMNPALDALVPDDSWEFLWWRIYQHISADRGHALHAALLLTAPSPVQRVAEPDPRIGDAIEWLLRRGTVYAIRMHVRREDGELEFEVELDRGHNSCGSN